MPRDMPSPAMMRVGATMQALRPHRSSNGCTAILTPHPRRRTMLAGGLPCAILCAFRGCPCKHVSCSGLGRNRHDAPQAAADTSVAGRGQSAGYMTQSKPQLQVERGRVGSRMTQRCLRPGAVMLDAGSLKVVSSMHRCSGQAPVEPGMPKLMA